MNTFAKKRVRALEGSEGDEGKEERKVGKGSSTEIANWIVNNVARDFKWVFHTFAHGLFSSHFGLVGYEI